MIRLMENWRRYKGEVEEEYKVEDEEDTIEEDDEYTSVKKAKREKALLKPDRGSWVAGADDLKQLSMGIAEDEACGHNPYRNASGEYTSAGDATVFTTGYSSDNKRGKDCPEQNKWQSSGGNKGTKSKRPCGRNPKTGKKYQYRCRDNAKLWEENTDEDGFIRLQPSALESIVTKIVRDELEKHQTINEGLSAKQIQSLCNQNGYSTTADFLKRQNAYVASAKGDLYKDKS